jgi:hypothetical protein
MRFGRYGNALLRSPGCKAVQEGTHKMGTITCGYQFDLRNPPEAGWSFADIYREMFRQAERAEELGFDSLWLTEPHFTDDGIVCEIVEDLPFFTVAS